MFFISSYIYVYFLESNDFFVGHPYCPLPWGPQSFWYEGFSSSTLCSQVPLGLPESGSDQGILLASLRSLISLQIIVK